MNRSRGFTLIEIIVVLVIVGILAAIALPAYFSWIQKSRAAEGLAGMEAIKEELVPCLEVHATTNLSACGFPSGCTYPSAERNLSCYSISGFGSESGLGTGTGEGNSGQLSGNFYYLVLPFDANISASIPQGGTLVPVFNAEEVNGIITGITAISVPSGNIPWTIIATYKDISGSLVLNSPDVSVAATCAGQGVFQGVC